MKILGFLYLIREWKTAWEQCIQWTHKMFPTRCTVLIPSFACIRIFINYWQKTSCKVQQSHTTYSYYQDFLLNSHMCKGVTKNHVSYSVSEYDDFTLQSLNFSVWEQKKQLFIIQALFISISFHLWISLWKSWTISYKTNIYTKHFTYLIKIALLWEKWRIVG